MVLQSPVKGGPPGLAVKGFRGLGVKGGFRGFRG